MRLIESVRQKPYHHRMRLLWIVLGISLVLLIVLWIVTSQFKPEKASDANLLKDIESQVRKSQEYWKSQLPDRNPK